MDLESPNSPIQEKPSKPAEKKPAKKPTERKIKPHEKVAVDYTKGLFAAQEETSDQAPLVVVVQGSKNVNF